MRVTPLDAIRAAFGNRKSCKIAIAVSGGGDSLALLDLAAGLAGEHDAQIMAVTLDHGLRPEAAAEARMVAEIAARLGVAHQTLTWRDWDGQGNLQAKAREARYGLIATWAKAECVDEIWLGHTLDDVAETFLIRLGRAAGLEGLSRMEAHFIRNGARWQRPLLGVSRADLRAHLTARDLSWVDDPSNDDSTYTRVRMRQALPLLAELGLSAEAIARSAAALSASRAVLDGIIAREWQRRARFEAGDLCLSLEGTDPEVARRLIVAGLRRVGGAAWPVRHSALQDLMVRIEAVGRHTLAGCLVTGDGAGLRIAREWRAVAEARAPLSQLWDGRWSLSGPRLDGAEIRALGRGIMDCPDWRETRLPRASLMAGPAVWQGERLVAAPLARKEAEWGAKLHSSFISCPFAH